MDISGELQRDISHNVLKSRLNSNGETIPNSFSADLRNDLDKINEVTKAGYCGSCYGGLEPEGGCCNTCEEVRQSYVNRGWSFANPEAIEQVSVSQSSPELSIDGDWMNVVPKRRLGRQAEGTGR